MMQVLGMLDSRWRETEWVRQATRIDSALPQGVKDTGKYPPRQALSVQ